MHGDDLARLLDERRWAKIDPQALTSRPVTDLALDDGFVQRFPRLARLMRLARVTEFHVAPPAAQGRAVAPAQDSGPFKPGTLYRLFAWTTQQGRFAAWPVSPWSSITVPDRSAISQDHALILRNLGGLNDLGAVHGEELDDADTNFSLNQNFVFGLDNAGWDTKRWIEDYEYDHRTLDSETVIRPHCDFQSPQWVCFAQEANGNELIYKLDDGEVLLVSGDHCFSYARPSADPQWRYESASHQRDMFWRIDGAATLRDWAEALASQWLARIEAAPAAQG